MSGARQAMTHRCTTERDTSTADNHGGKLPGGYQPHLEDVPCRAYYQAGQFEQKPEQQQAVEALALLLPIGTDLDDRKDRIVEITDRQGVLLFAGPLQLDGPIIRRQDHLQITLRQVT